MFGHKVAHGGQHETSTGIEIRLPADRSQLFLIRSLVTTIALRQDFDLDEVEDIKLAVDELCSALMTRAWPGAQLELLLRPGPRDDQRHRIGRAPARRTRSNAARSAGTSSSRSPTR